VRVRRGNILLIEATACEAVSQLQTIVAFEDITTLRAVHGEHTTTSLVTILLSIPNRAWTVADDLWLMSEFWRVQAGAAAAAPRPPLHGRSSILGAMLTARQLHADRRGRTIFLSRVMWTGHGASQSMASHTLTYGPTYLTINKNLVPSW
jgi:hypothetical protein